MKLKNSYLLEVVPIVWHGDPLHSKTYRTRARNDLEAEGNAEPSRRAIERELSKNDNDGSFNAFLRVFRSLSEEPDVTHRNRHATSPDQAFEDDKIVLDMLVTMIGADEPTVKPRWLAFERFRNAVRRDQPEIPLSAFLDFIYEQGDREFDDVELLSWMLAGYLEFHCVDRGFSIGQHKNSFVGSLVPPEIWIPEADDQERLSTSRYKVLDHLVRHSTADSSNRIVQYLRGDRRWRSSSDGTAVRALEVKKAYVTLLGRPYDGVFRTHIEGILQFAKIFEWYQLVKLCISNEPASEIKRSFTRFPANYALFYDELHAYCDARSSHLSNTKS